MLFWLIAGLMALISAVILLTPLLRGAKPGATSAANIGVYRDQLDEVDRDLARNVITDTEAEALRIEVSRRLLAAADADGVTVSHPNENNSNVALILSVCVLGTGMAGYSMIGHPGLPDQPLALRIEQEEAARAARPSQTEALKFLAENGDIVAQPEANPEHLKLLEQLRTVLAEKPDPRGHKLLASNLARLGRWEEAYQAQGNAIELLGEDATGADYVDHAEFMILAVNGYVSPQAELALREAMQRVPTDPRARYYSGLLAAQAGRPDITWDLWMRLLQDGPPDAPWIAAIQSQIGDIARATGRELPSGPNRQQIEDASAMSDEDRAQFIQSMVERLSDRLATEGGPPEEWAQLIRVLSVQGQTERAAEIWAEAQTTFADNPDALTLLQATATEVGLSE